MTNPIAIHDRLTEQYLRYYDTPFAVRDRSVMQERRRLLLQDRAIRREPWLEPIAPYAVVADDLGAACERAGADPDLAEFAALGLLPPGARLRTHQFEALRASCADDKHVIVTAGTGSGKTEAFLLPLFSSLLNESAGWSTNNLYSPSTWWDGDRAEFEPQRGQERGRQAAVRALVLYPMNALVDDQLKRLRLALDSDAARGWLDQHRGGHRFFFGRYTSRTPLAGPQTRDRERRLARQLKSMAQRAGRVRDDEDRRYFVAQLDGAEMRSRWDMQRTPPDILITNYSMLNVMLLRGIEEPIFEQTRQWLAESSDHRFTVVLDELHMYRGTPGTEIRFLLRNLLHRLDIADRPEKVRFLAASASAGGDEAKFDEFINGFFAQDRGRFAVLPGSLDFPSFDPAPLQRVSQHLAAYGGALAEGDDAAAAIALREAETTAGASQGPGGVCAAVQADAALLDACSDTAEGGARVVRARPISAIAGLLFPGMEPEPAVLALRGLLQAMHESHGDRSGTTIRAHYFFRSIQGMWACSNAQCPGAERVEDEARTVGKLFRSHQLSCDACGSRVLELMYCQTCGELFLGGYRTADPFGDPETSYLVPDQPELGALPDQASSERTTHNYAMYWPRTDVPLAVKPWTKQNNTFKLAFAPCEFDPRTGRLSAGGTEPTGFTFKVAGPPDRPFPALPTRCPHCDDDWERGGAGRAPEDPGRAQSPIRYMRTGFEKVTQVLADALLREIAAADGQRKLVAFTDSRQDAAKLSAGMERRHYEDTVRQLLARAMRGGAPGSADLPLFEAFIREEDPSEQARAAFDRFSVAFRDEANVLLTAVQPFATDSHRARADLIRRQFQSPATRFEALVDETERQLLDLGMNPAGPANSKQYKKAKGEPAKRWTGLYDFSASPPCARLPSELGQTEKDWLQEIRADLRWEAVRLTFAARRRDFESIGLAYACPSEPGDGQGPRAEDFEAACAVLRILGDERQFMRWGKSRDEMPPVVRDYLAKVAERARRDPGDVARDVQAVLEGAGVVREWVIQDSQLYLMPSSGEAWICTGCRQVHLHRAGKTCTNCLAELPAEPVGVAESEDYYAHLASHEQAFRLRSEELTGQTDWEEAQDRQAQFQGIFLDGASDPRVDEIDMLSVTTTMEVGVDIGALRAVLMGNMPPMRFNYQQRVGRAGRRNDPLAAALTVCRGRSHDDYYFLHPERITGDPPPVPYIDLRREPIIRRSALSEVLRRAFRATGANSSNLGDNIHGAFGKAEEWPKAEHAIATWMQSHRDEIDAVAGAMLEGCHEQLRSRRSELTAYLSGGVLADIRREAAREDAASADLSQRLAEAGLLPMFGFPSRTRVLYHGEPRRWPPQQTIEREASIALSVWAPGGEVVKDKALHRVVGLAAYEPRGRSAVPADPLGRERPLGQCSACATIDATTDGEKCPSCGAPLALDGEAGYRRLTLIQPLGYRTDYKARDYHDWFEWAPGGSRPRMASNPLGETSVLGGRVASGTSEIYEINDNRGRDWELHQQSDGHGWISPEALDPADRGWLTRTGQESRKVALGAIKSTDVLVVGVSPDAIPPWAVLDPRDIGRRAAWYSLGFLLRGAASRLLEVQTDELDVGVRALRREQEVIGQIFLADSLANGAGYCTHLGNEAEFRRLLDEARSWIVSLSDPSRHDCDSACYDCLKDYRNAPYHGLLDWRMAADLLTLLRRETLDPELRWHHAGQDALDAFCADLQFERAMLGDTPAAIDRNGRRALIVVHPFEENPPEALRHDRHATAREDASGQGLDLHTASFFELIRTPAGVFRRFAEGAAGG